MSNLCIINFLIKYAAKNCELLSNWNEGCDLSTLKPKNNGFPIPLTEPEVPSPDIS